jgi:aspartate kinase
VLSSFKEGAGTLIHFSEKTAAHKGVTGIAFSRHEAKLSVTHLHQQPTTITNILTALHLAHIDVDMLTSQIIAPDNMELTFTLSRDDYPRAIKALEPQKFIGNTKIAKLSLVGLGLRSHPAIITTLFETLGSEGILAQLVSTSEIRTSVVIDEQDVERGMRALHTAFGLDSAP